MDLRSHAVGRAGDGDTGGDCGIASRHVWKLTMWIAGIDRTERLLIQSIWKVGEELFVRMSTDCRVLSVLYCRLVIKMS